MTLSSPIYLFFFFPLFWLGGMLLHGKGRKLWLCVALLAFYAFADLRSLPLLLGFCAFQYGMGLCIGGKKLLLLLGVVADTAFLLYFKLTGNAPVGLSFFTFQAIAYLAEVYRAPEKASRDPMEVLLYLCFFPRLICGPLMGWSEHHRQYRTLHMDAKGSAEGLRRFALGLGKKVLIADMLAPVVNEVYAADPSAVGTAGAWLAALAYCLQLYFDFSGYSDMAIGMGRAFGFSFPENFDRPYAAHSIADFWRRWHITLGEWFRKYVYIPLGGNQKGRFRTACNKALVFVLTGLWHGLGWTYLLWGLWHALFSALESLCHVRRRVSRLYTFPVVLLGFVMFRAADVGQGLTLLGRMFSYRAGLLPGMNGVRITALVLGIALSLYKRPKDAKKLIPAWVNYSFALLVFVLSLCVMAGNDFTPFIYAQF